MSREVEAAHVFAHRHAAQRAVISESPAVVHAFEGLRITVTLMAEKRAAVPANVMEQADAAVLLAHQKQVPTAYLVGLEVAGPGYLAVMSDEDPGPAEKPFQFLGEDRGVGVDALMYRVIFDQRG